MHDILFDDKEGNESNRCGMNDFRFISKTMCVWLGYTSKKRRTTISKK